jgi:hypothetical protein
MTHASDAQRMVAESCLVALDTLAYWVSARDFLTLNPKP